MSKVEDMDIKDTICLNCGKHGEGFLCDNCRTEDALDSVFNALIYFRPDTCQNEYILEVASEYDSPYAVHKVIPELLGLFDSDTTDLDYYYCRYLKSVRDNSFEERALRYLSVNRFENIKTQAVLKDLLDTWIRNDFEKPQEWCDKIADTPDLCCELYYQAAQFYAMTGEYDKVDEVIDYAVKRCGDLSYNSFLQYNRESELQALSRLKQDNERYRTKKPYWPSTEERRKAVAVIYDKKGIKYQMTGSSGISEREKIKESDFTPIKEYLGDPPDSFSAFWCADAFVKTGLMGVYQIAAIRVRDNKITDCFQSYIHPWDGQANLERAAKAAGVEAEVLENAAKVSEVIPKFFEFAGDDILVSTGALGNQAKLISRAARYSKIDHIDNLFYDLLDYAADVSEEFDMMNNTRAFLLKHFKLSEGKDALEKAIRNVDIFNCLKEIDR